MTVAQKMVTVVIPIYTLELNRFEVYSLNQCVDILGSRYPIAVVKPKSLAIGNEIEPLNRIKRLEIVEFDDSYFENLKGYNRLMLSAEFYSRFADSKYILIYQTDALVFRDELEAWCKKDFDYIGAPWLPKFKYTKPLYRPVLYARILMSLLQQKKTKSLLRYFKVGNGGLSLRRVASFLSVIDENPGVVEEYKEKSLAVDFYEDVFWSIKASRLARCWNVAGYKEACSFSFETHPETAFRINGDRLPFGTHAWYKPPYWTFWKQFIAME